MGVIEENTATMKELIAELKAFNGRVAGSTGETPAGETRKPGRPPGSGTKGPSLDEVKAIAERVRDEISPATAINLIKKHGAEKLLGLDKSKYAAFIAAAEVALDAAKTPAEEPATEEL
jgi:predicted NAD/FAD-binding protein